MLFPELGRTRLWSALREMERLQERLNELVGDWERPTADFPPINIWTSENDALVTAEIPGVDPDSIDVQVLNSTLTLKGSREPCELRQEGRYHRCERGYGQFTRTIELPFHVNADEVNAEFARGVLRVKLPRAAEDKPRKIAVKAA